MNLAKIDGQTEMITLPLGDLELKAPLTVYIKRDLFDRLIVIMAQAFDPAQFAKSVGQALYLGALDGVATVASQIVDELPLGQFEGWNDPGRGGSVDPGPPAA